MNAVIPTRTVPAASGSRSRVLLLLLTAGLLAAVGGGDLRAADADRVNPARKRAGGPRPPGPGVPAILKNGIGDRTAEITVDAYGEISSLLFDPVGPQAQAETVASSRTWFSKAGNDTGGNGVFLGEDKMDGRNPGLPPLAFVSFTASSATSEFTIGTIKFQLVQQLLQPSDSGCTLRQAYNIKNEGTAPTKFDLIRSLDGDLQFDSSIIDGAARVRDRNPPPGLSPFQLLFEFDSASDPTNPEAFVGIDVNGMANLGFRVAEFDFEPDVFSRGRAVLDTTFTKDDACNVQNAENADVDMDGITDGPYDVTLQLGQSFVNVPPGGSVLFVTNTILGSGPPQDVIEAPSNLTATPASTTQIDLNWRDNSSRERTFRVERKPGPTLPGFQEIVALGADTTTYADTGLIPDTLYTYRVRAFYNPGPPGTASPYSNEAPNFTPPIAPILNGLVTSAIQLDLSWTDTVKSPGNYELERKAPADAGFVPYAALGEAVNTFSDTGLTPATLYKYRIRAVNPGGASAYSNEAPLTTLPLPPTAPSGLNATVPAAPTGITQLNLAWIDNSSNEDGFFIERTSAAGTVILTAAPNTTSFPDSPLDPDTDYTYRIKAFNIGGNSAFNGPVSARTLPTPPQAPYDLMATVPAPPAGSTQIDLEWSDGSNNEDTFDVERKLSSDPDLFFAVIVTVDPNTTIFSDTGLAPNTSYTYRVRAKNAGGYSAYSGTASATTLPLPPAAPSAMAAGTVTQTTVDLSWSDNSNNETGFEIQQTSSAGGTVVTYNIPANEESFHVAGLTADVLYTFRIRAVNTGGPSAFTPDLNVRTLPNPPNPPSVFSATAVSASQINLTWNDNSNNEDGFELIRSTEPITLGPGRRPPSGDVVRTLPANTTSLNDTGLTSNTTYFYAIAAFNTGGFSDPDFDDATTLNIPPEFVSPTPPNNFIIDVFAGDDVSYTIAGQDADENLLSLSVSGAPGGSTHTPSLPINGAESPVSTAFSFTSTSKAKFEVTYTLSDDKGGSVTRTIKINVKERPQDSVCPSGTVAGTHVEFRGAAGYAKGAHRPSGKMIIKNTREKINVTSTEITGYSRSGKRATILGSAKVNGKTGHSFSMIVEDNGPGPKDRLIELRVDGQAWPSGRLVKGDVHFHNDGSHH